MPWKVYRENNKFVVRKLKPDGSKGKKVPGGEHTERAAAVAHQRALYANTGEK